MNLIAGIIMAAIGFIVAVLGAFKVVHGLTGTGILMLLAGGLIIGLSFVSPPEPDETERMSTPATLVNIFFAPADVFRNLRSHPRWLVALLIMSALSAAYYNLFMYHLTPDRVTNYAIDKTMEVSFIPDERKKQIEENRPQAIADAKNPIISGGQAVSGFAGSMLLYAFGSAIFLLFALAMGGKINFFQSLSVLIYASFPIAVLRFILNSIILFIKDPTDIHPITGQRSLIQDNLNFLVLPAEHPVIYTILGSLSLLAFYWVWLNGIGLKNAGEKVTGSIAWTSALSVYGILVLLGVILAFLFPSFIS